MENIMVEKGGDFAAKAKFKPWINPQNIFNHSEFRTDAVYSKNYLDLPWVK